MSSRSARFAWPRRAVIWAALAGGSLTALAGITAGAQAAPLPTLAVSLGKGSIAVSGSTVSGGVNVAVSTAKGLKEPAAVLSGAAPGG